jgi:hypothetical protein
MYGTICIATKTDESTAGRTPQQSVYADTRVWQDGVHDAPAHVSTDAHD